MADDSSYIFLDKKFLWTYVIIFIATEKPGAQSSYYFNKSNNIVKNKTQEKYISEEMFKMCYSS